MRKPFSHPSLRFWDKVIITENCWVWIGNKNQFGYGLQALGKGNKRALAHRTSYEMHKGAIPEGKHICHTCDHPWCVNPEHLFAGTRSDNMTDCVKKGRHVSNTHPGYVTGSKNGRTKLSEEDIINIFKMRKEGALIREMAKKFGSSNSRISAILNKRNWTHVTCP